VLSAGFDPRLYNENHRPTEVISLEGSLETAVENDREEMTLQLQ
jgi:hypothetical protein